MTSIVKISIVLLCCLTMAPCTKIVEFDLEETELRTVIEAQMVKDSFATVRVTKTAAYLKNQPVPYVGDATVIISDDLGSSEVLTHLGNGYYKGNTLVGSTARVYTLSVTADGKEHTAITGIPESVPFEISGVNYYGDDNAFREPGYYPKINTSLPPGIDSYYLFKYYINGVPHRPEGWEDDVFITDSKFIGTEITDYETEYTYQAGDVARLDIYRVTKETYNFYIDLSLQLNNDGGFFSTPPANTSTNFNNGAIGVFMGAGRASESITIVP